MKNIKSLIIGAFIIIILGLACAVNTEAATGKYVKSISEIVPEGEYILEAVKIVLDMETHNSISKKMIISVCKWLVEIAEKAVSPCEDCEGDVKGGEI